MNRDVRQLLPAVLIAVLTLAGCSSEPESAPVNVVEVINDGAEAPPVALPPMLTSSRTYRCKDNSLVYLDFFNDQVTVHLRTEKNGPFTVLTASQPGKAFAAQGYSLSGTGSNVEIARPGKPPVTCKA